MFENPRRGRQARNFTTNVPKILVLKSSSEQMFSRKLPLGAPDVQISSSCYSVELHITDLLDMGSYQLINNNIETICSNIFRTFLDWNFL